MNIYEKLNFIQINLRAPKSQYNKFGKFSYRNCEDILEALKPLLEQAKAALVINDNLIEIAGRIYIKSTASLRNIEEPGEEVRAIGYAREPEELKGMQEPQITGACSSYARKYALNALFLIDDVKDPDSNEVSRGFEQPRAVANATPQRVQSSGRITQKQANRIYAIAKEKGFTHEDVEKVIAIYGKKKAEDLTKSEYEAIIERLEKAPNKAMPKPKAEAKAQAIQTEQAFFKNVNLDEIQKEFF